MNFHLKMENPKTVSDPLSVYRTTLLIEACHLSNSPTDVAFLQWLIHVWWHCRVQPPDGPKQTDNLLLFDFWAK